ncbi:Ion transport 2 domain protein [Desulfotomaculum nigrificans CO-1-SRB]|uniref:Ion transport 2 domain protein n=1 Tax=Desulfotomaculum nigrificans (strain DSM 14880 / VKM B-2319 / CO-1-SRB) TaxID=868595 RepID=F6B955_DESCC|nr:potassium channel family protein [Desulfotomaculum nigrificans]AEF94827.1 Ion transport 2 domain protein [Desulfotomaculum nigrificans CO-1-SRB]
MAGLFHLLHSLAIILALLGTVLLLVHSFGPVNRQQPGKPPVNVVNTIIFITHRLLLDHVVESTFFRIAVYSVMVPFLYIFILQDLIPGLLVEGIMLAGLVLSFYQICRGIAFCLLSPGVVFTGRSSSRFFPVLMIVSWLLIIIFNLYTLILLVSHIDPCSFIDSSGPVTEPLRLLYFTVITFTGVGYGDITPRGNLAVFIAIIVSLAGFLYSALFIGGILAAFTKYHGKSG